MNKFVAFILIFFFICGSFVTTFSPVFASELVEDSWTSKASIPTQRIHAFSTVVDNKLIIIDQVVQYSYPEYSSVRVIATMKVMIYDSKTDVWSEGQPSPEYYSWDTDMMRHIVAGATTGSHAPKKLYVIFGSASVYVYDPVENTWLTIAGPSTSVVGYGVAVVDDLLYIFGGIHHPHVENMQYVPFGHKNAVPTPEPSNPTADFWCTKVSMSQARFGLGVIAVNGKIYAIGGSTEIGLKNSLTGINDRYDPVTDTWTTLEPMPTPRTNFAIVAYQGKIYCMGGRSFERGTQIECAVVEVYDIATNDWSTKPFLPFNGGSQAYVIQEKIFVIKLSSYMESNLYIYDPEIDKWTEKNSLPYIHNLVHISAVVDNKLIAMGSFMFNQLSADGTNFELTSKKKTLVYDPETDSWSEKQAVSPILNYIVTGVTSGIHAPQKIYVPTVFDTYVYNPISDTWSSAKTMFTPRTDFGVAVVDDILYVIGGLTHTTTGIASSYMNEQYVSFDYGTVSGSPEPKSPKHTSIYIIVTLLSIIVGTAAVSLFVYLRVFTNREIRVIVITL
jgi:N-acetylneuraminic acid mutarotase